MKNSFKKRIDYLIIYWAIIFLSNFLIQNKCSYILNVVDFIKYFCCIAKYSNSASVSSMHPYKLELKKKISFGHFGTVFVKLQYMSFDVTKFV